MAFLIIDVKTAQNNSRTEQTTDSKNNDSGLRTSSGSIRLLFYELNLYISSAKPTPFNYDDAEHDLSN